MCSGSIMMVMEETYFLNRVVGKYQEKAGLPYCPEKGVKILKLSLWENEPDGLEVYLFRALTERAFYEDMDVKPFLKVLVEYEDHLIEEGRKRPREPLLHQKYEQYRDQE